MTMRRHLVIFARWPQAGAGKRRLAAGVGAVEALRFQRVRLAVLCAALGRDPRWMTWLAVTPDWSAPWPSSIARVGQGRGDLGQRMGRIMTTLPVGPVVIIGTDIPRISAPMIWDAFRALGQNAAVFGPAGDGGYWLVGLRRRPAMHLPFEGVRWSSAHALADTVANLGGANVAYVDRLDDVDAAAALKAALDWGRVCKPAMPRTYMRKDAKLADDA